MPPLIVIVDDEPAIRELLALALEDTGYHVRCAADGGAELALFAGKPVDLLITDVMMPRMSGPELVARLRAGLGPATPTILMRAVTPDTLPAPIAFIAKPCEKEAVGKAPDNADMQADGVADKAAGSRTPPIRPGTR